MLWTTYREPRHAWPGWMVGDPEELRRRVARQGRDVARVWDSSQQPCIRAGHTRLAAKEILAGKRGRSRSASCKSRPSRAGVTEQAADAAVNQACRLLRPRRCGPGSPRLADAAQRAHLADELAAEVAQLWATPVTQGQWQCFLDAQVPQVDATEQALTGRARPPPVSSGKRWPGCTAPTRGSVRGPLPERPQPGGKSPELTDFLRSAALAVGRSDTTHHGVFVHIQSRAATDDRFHEHHLLGTVKVCRPGSLEVEKLRPALKQQSRVPNGLSVSLAFGLTAPVRSDVDGRHGHLVHPSACGSPRPACPSGMTTPCSPCHASTILGDAMAAVCSPGSSKSRRQRATAALAWSLWTARTSCGQLPVPVTVPAPGPTRGSVEQPGGALSHPGASHHAGEVPGERGQWSSAVVP